MAAQAQRGEMMSAEQDFQNKIAGIRDRFRESLPEQQVDLAALFARLQTGDGAAMALSEIRGQAHKIRGVAATLGFLELGEYAASLEDTITAFGAPDAKQDTLAATFVSDFERFSAEMARISGA